MQAQSGGGHRFGPGGASASGAPALRAGQGGLRAQGPLRLAAAARERPARRLQALQPGLVLPQQGQLQPGRPQPVRLPQGRLWLRARVLRVGSGLARAAERLPPLRRRAGGQLQPQQPRQRPSGEPLPGPGPEPGPLPVVEPIRWPVAGHAFLRATDRPRQRATDAAGRRPEALPAHWKRVRQGWSAAGRGTAPAWFPPPQSWTGRG